MILFWWQTKMHIRRCSDGISCRCRVMSLHAISCQWTCILASMIASRCVAICVRCRSILAWFSRVSVLTIGLRKSKKHSVFNLFPCFYLTIWFISCQPLPVGGIDQPALEAEPSPAHWYQGEACVLDVHNSFCTRQWIPFHCILTACSGCAWDDRHVGCRNATDAEHWLTVDRQQLIQIMPCNVTNLWHIPQFHACITGWSWVAITFPNLVKSMVELCGIATCPGLPPWS